MNKKYIAPSLDIAELDAANIIATSPTIENGDGEGSHSANSKKIYRFDLGRYAEEPEEEEW